MSEIRTNEMHEEELLESLLADMGLGEDVVETVETEAETVIGETKIEAADPTTVEPTETVEVVEPTTTTEKPKKEKKAKAPKEAKPKTEKKEKPAVVRKHYASKTERLTDKFGDKLGDFLILEAGDALLEGDALKAKQDETLEIIKGAGKKVQARITFILEFVGGKTAKLNGVIETAFKLLNSDGALTTGVEGNLHKALIAHPYSPAAAKAMGGNSVLAMAKLKVIQKNEKGDFVANPNSTVLAAMNGMLGLK